MIETYLELFREARRRAPADEYITVGVETESASSDVPLVMTWKIYRSSTGFHEGETPEAVLAKAFPLDEALNVVDAHLLVPPQPMAVPIGKGESPAPTDVAAARVIGRSDKEEVFF